MKTPASLAANPEALIPAIAQDVVTGEVLMVAFMNLRAFEATVKTGAATYWSRSRNELWIKGATSGHTQKVHEILLDCDEDAVVLKVEQTGGACHTGARTCFTSQGSPSASSTESGLASS